jgi:hypothetical protein
MMRSRTNGNESPPEPPPRAVFMDPRRRRPHAGAVLPLESAAHRFSPSSMSSSTRDVARLPLLPPLLVPELDEFVDMILVSFRWIIPADLLADDPMDNDDDCRLALLLAVESFACFTARRISLMSKPTRSNLLSKVATTLVRFGSRSCIPRSHAVMTF